MSASVSRGCFKQQLCFNELISFCSLCVLALSGSFCVSGRPFHSLLGVEQLFRKWLLV